MKKTILFALLVFMVGSCLGVQGAAKIRTLDDLKAAINSPSSFEAIRDMDSWLPGLILSLIHI